MSATAAAFSAVTRNDGCAAIARSTKRRTAADCVSASAFAGSPGSGTGNGGSLNILLDLDFQQLAARRQDLDARTRLQQLLRELRTGVRDVLAVVEDQQELPILDMLKQCVRDPAPRLLLDPERRRHRLRHQPRIRERRELDEPYAIGKVVQHLGAHLQRDPCLAQSADARHRHEAVPVEPSLDFGELAVAADERRELLRQIVRLRAERAQRGKVAPQRWVDELVDALGSRQIAQAHAAEVRELGVWWEASDDEQRHRLREQHLAAVRRVHDVLRAIDGRPK